MALETLKAEIAMLLDMLGDHPEDRHELSIQLKEKLNQIRAFGMPLPEDLVQLEAELEREFAAEKKAAGHSWDKPA
jgi:hypothetical protein